MGGTGQSGADRAGGCASPCAGELEGVFKVETHPPCAWAVDGKRGRDDLFLPSAPFCHVVVPGQAKSL